MKVLFLYSEVAGYFLACAEALHLRYGCEVHIVRWPINPVAPFKFRSYAGVTFYERQDLDVPGMLALYRQLQPDLVYVSGWMDKGYMHVAKQIKRDGIPVVCGSDNHWRGDLRQLIATAISPVYLHSRYTHMWVPGLYQYEFARRLGFPPSRILTGMYCADTPRFESVYHATQSRKAAHYPHHFLFVGRYEAVKGITELCEAFISLSDRRDWRLTLVGAGPLKSQLPTHEAITYRGFVQPEELPKLAGEMGCVVLPSRDEPWGVALHEFAAAGLPIITSSVFGAATAFVRNGYNGFIHAPEDVTSIKAALQAMIQLDDEALREMGRLSHQLSLQLTPQSWAATLLSVLPQYAPFSHPQAMQTP